MLYLAIVLIASSSFYFGFKLGAYGERLYLQIVFEKMVIDLIQKHNLNTQDAAQSLRETVAKFKSGEYNAVGIYRSAK